MMSALTRKLDELKRLQECYKLHKDSDDQHMRRKAHLDIDRFLMENRETALVCMERVIEDEIRSLKVEGPVKPKRRALSWLRSLTRPVDM